MPHLRLIGDVHGHQSEYLQLTKDAKYSIQLGDMGFDYKSLRELDAQKHRFLPGNHDNYDQLPEHALGPSGVWRVPECFPEYFSGQIFYIRGALSVDRGLRVEGKTWWRDEEISFQQMEQAVEMFHQTKPDFVISHTCPYHVLEEMPEFLSGGWGNQGIIQNRTQQMLEAMFQVHQPKLWVFAHYHKPLNVQLLGTRFICLDTLKYLDFDANLRRRP
jgi:hypothetical protein